MFEMEKFMLKRELKKIKEFAVKDERAMADVVEIDKGLGLVIVIGAIMIFIADKTVTATGTPADSNLSKMQSSILETGSTGATFIIVLVIAFIGAIAISYMGLLGGGRGRKK